MDSRSRPAQNPRRISLPSTCIKRVAIVQLASIGAVPTRSTSWRRFATSPALPSTTEFGQPEQATNRQVISAPVLRLEQDCPNVNFPETNPLLLIRLRDREDEQAWFEFAELYRPAIIRLAQRKGLQPADCEDLAQGVLVAVAGAIDRWKADDKRARFRTWLYTVANRQVIDALRRKACSPASGGTSLQMRLNEAEDRREDSRLLRMELRRQAFHRAAAIAKEDFSPADWQAFWLMAIEGMSAAEVSQQVGKTVGAVYAAKGRVMRRLIERIRDLEQQLSDTGLET